MNEQEREILVQIWIQKIRAANAHLATASVAMQRFGISVDQAAVEIGRFADAWKRVQDTDE